jgi:hypothetical protein
MNLFQASEQWSSRPADERFWTIGEAHAACKAYHAQAREATVNLQDCRVYAEGNEVRLNGKAASARFSHYGFGQFARIAGAPANYLRTLPTQLAADCLQNGLKKLGSDGASTRLLFHGADSPTKGPRNDLMVRAATSEQYSRIWNDEVLSHCLRAGQAGWLVPPAWGFAQGITSLSQSEKHFDDRVALDRAAGRVLELAF